MLDEELHNLRMAKPGCQLQRIIAAIVIGVHVSPVLDEEPHNVRVALLGSAPQLPISTTVHISPMLDEELHNVCVAIL